MSNIKDSNTFNDKKNVPPLRALQNMRLSGCGAANPTSECLEVDLDYDADEDSPELYFSEEPSRMDQPTSSHIKPIEGDNLDHYSLDRKPIGRKYPASQAMFDLEDYHVHNPSDKAEVSDSELSAYLGANEESGDDGEYRHGAKKTGSKAKNKTSAKSRFKTEAKATPRKISLVWTKTPSNKGSVSKKKDKEDSEEEDDDDKSEGEKKEPESKENTQERYKSCDNCNQRRIRCVEGGSGVKCNDCKKRDIDCHFSIKGTRRASTE